MDDLPKAVQFYENMSWQAAQTGPSVAAFKMDGIVFGLYPWQRLFIMPRYIPFPNAGHYPTLEEPDMINSALRKWLVQPMVLS